ncbi:YciI family protein [Pseudonocardia sp.]|uniref:YciI family protein n=1 Tax=Pseudonocardia sp. TaxID=60912 RepID=UPI00262F072A|nr:YciI family protein [Pseudonocardia sp.]MCW2721647.1 hypothetical protein [Pseudonocardia sp.]MDT7612821.1 hypothetical protein [Pseudonocardiales bacterium]
MKFLVLVYDNPASREQFLALPAEQRGAALAAYRVLDEELDATGEKIVSSPLAYPERTVQVRVAGGRTMTTDGPFAEVKEQLAGFYLLECDTQERAVQIAAKVPESEFGIVEVRPLMDLSAFEG